MLPEFIRRALWRLGYDFYRLDTGGWTTDRLRKKGLAPATIIDVGVGNGTSVLYEAFPDAYLVLVEPLSEFEPRLKGILESRSGEYMLVAAGSSDGRLDLRVDRDIPQLSSPYDRTPLTARHEDQLEDRTVPVATLDSLAIKHKWVGPFGIKIDTEGHEYDVLSGSKETLKQTQFVIAEVSIARRFEASYSFAQVVAAMDSRGFTLCDILSSPMGKDGQCLLYVDALFVRSHPLM